MKKITESNIGIWTISVIPSLIAYISAYKIINMNISINNHLPFIISISLLLAIVSCLYIRKWVLDKINAIQILFDERIVMSDTIFEFVMRKHDEQFQIFADEFFKVSEGKSKDIKRASITESEKGLIEQLDKYNQARLKNIIGILDKKFD